MGYAELIEKLKALPADKQAEVFDFVEFLAARCGKDTTAGPWAERDFADFSLAQALRGLEDDPVTYTAADVKESWR